MRAIVKLTSVVSIVLAISSQAIAEIVFSDSDFNDSDWTSQLIQDTTPSQTGSFTRQQTVVGGNGDPYQQTTLNWVATGSGSQGVVVVHLRLSAVYSPTSQGAIQSIDYYFDDILISQVGGTPEPFNPPALFQNGAYYASYTTSTSNFTWQSHSRLEMTASDFALVAGSGSPHPDFSSSGPEIQFGYIISSAAAFAGTYSITSGIDNWVFSLHSVPDRLLGDYNDDGEVDAADYVMWRKGGPLKNQGDDPSQVNEGDYAFWRARFGNGLLENGGQISATEVPEPVTSIPTVALAILSLSASACRSHPVFLLRQFLRRCPVLKTQLASIALILVSTSLAHAQVFVNDLTGFNMAAGNPPIAIDFDAIHANTIITGQTIAGATLSAPGAPLIVVRGLDTFSTGQGGPQHVLIPTTLENVLSPGGVELAFSNPVLENDDLRIVFRNPVKSFGFDHLSQSADGFSFTQISVVDQLGGSLFSGTIPISNFGGAGAPAGNDFWGFVSSSALIKTIIIDETDGGGSNPDSNIGFDTLRFFPVPEPSSALIVLELLAGIFYVDRLRAYQSRTRHLNKPTR